MFCGTAVPMPLQTDSNGGVLNNANHADFVGMNETLAAEICTAPLTSQMGTTTTSVPWRYPAIDVKNWCTACHDPETQSTDAMTGFGLWNDNFQMMGMTDSVALWLCMGLVALHMANEYTEIRLCKLAIERVGAKVPMHWSYSFKVINALRRHFFLPGVPTTITMLLLTNGADAMSICFNSVALIFLCDIDDIFYSLALPHQTRVATTRAAEQIRVTLSDDEEKSIFLSRLVLQVSIVVISRIGM